MFSKEEAKNIRVEFWNQFRDYTNNRRKNKGRTGKWILNRTGINAINLKFDLNSKSAVVGIYIETSNLDRRIDLYDKLESLRGQLTEALGDQIQWEFDYKRENGKSISRVYTEIVGVSIYDHKTWNRTNMFFFDRMTRLEDMYLEYKDLFIHDA